MIPIFGVREPALIRVFREPDAGDAWRLVYEEAPFADTLLAHADQHMQFRHRLVIARGLPLPVFRYFGWSDLGSRVNAAERSWFEEYDGLLRRFHPERIELRLGRDAAVFEVPARVDSVVASYSELE